MTHKPTPEQDAILTAVASSSANLMLVARAGCGKTSTLKLIDSTLRSAALLVCFNKSIAEDARKEVRGTTTVKTFNSLGHSIWAEYHGRKLTLNKNKLRDIYKAFADDAPRRDRSFLWSLYDSVTAAINMARAIGYIPASHALARKAIATWSDVERRLDETPLPEVQGIADKLLNLSIAQAYSGVIDFNDQVYMPALFAGHYPSFPMVMIDEYQDLSPVNHAMVSKLCRNSRQIGVGDPAQAIYEFRGADSNAMARATDQFSMDTFPLSLSFRCPSAITSNVHWLVPDIRSVRDGGSIHHGGSLDLRPDTAVICRYNAPLVRLALETLVSGTRVDVAGVDIGSRIIRLLEKLGPTSLSRSQALDAIANWEAERESLDSKTAPDLANCMRVFVNKTQTLDGAISYAQHLFSSTEGEIRFLSGHRSKGLEFDHVYHLDHESIKTSGQDPNIHYVIDTRPKESLTYIKSHH